MAARAEKILERVGGVNDPWRPRPAGIAHPRQSRRWACTLYVVGGTLVVSSSMPAPPSPVTGE
ncbi:MAG: hypothetical protein ACI8PT_001340 [Gammaproteobacteria bacterium]|jgi:hypothetical protein